MNYPMGNKAVVAVLYPSIVSWDLFCSKEIRNSPEDTTVTLHHGLRRLITDDCVFYGFCLAFPDTVRGYRFDGYVVLVDLESRTMSVRTDWAETVRNVQAACMVGGT